MWEHPEIFEDPMQWETLIEQGIVELRETKFLLHIRIDHIQHPADITKEINRGIRNWIDNYIQIDELGGFMIKRILHDIYYDHDVHKHVFCYKYYTEKPPDFNFGDHVPIRIQFILEGNESTKRAGDLAATMMGGYSTNTFSDGTTTYYGWETLFDTYPTNVFWKWRRAYDGDFYQPFDIMKYS